MILNRPEERVEWLLPIKEIIFIKNNNFFYMREDGHFDFERRKDSLDIPYYYHDKIL